MEQKQGAGGPRVASALKVGTREISLGWPVTKKGEGDTGGARGEGAVV